MDAHITDSTAHNLGIPALLAEQMGVEQKGLLKCSTHTVLRYDVDMASVVHSAEEKVGMKNIFRGFMIEVGIVPKHDSISLSSVK